MLPETRPQAAQYSVFADLYDVSWPKREIELYLVRLRQQLAAERVLIARVRPEVAVTLETIATLNEQNAERALQHVMASAAPHGDLAILLAPLLIDEGVLVELTRSLRHDPMLGFAQPRFADAADDMLFALPAVPGDAPPSLPRASVEALPHHYITTEWIAACTMIRDDVVASFTPSDDGATTMCGALRTCLAGARRRGYRNIVVNRTIVRSELEHSDVYPTVERTEHSRLLANHPDIAKADDWWTRGLLHRLERVASHARRARPRDRLRILLDCRGTQDRHNGTAHAALGLLDGLHNVAPAWDIDLLCTRRAMKFHALKQRYPTMKLLHDMPSRTYASAVCLDQPWTMSSVRELHRRAWSIGFNMLDTIAWDIVYPCVSDAERTWNFIARYSDVITFNSAFTRDRFNFRFPISQSVHTAITHHSLSVDEHVMQDARPATDGDTILLFGNDYDHKGIAPTLDLLTRAFPYARFTVVGAKGDRPNVTTLHSGKVPDGEIENLFATARLVVFPSFYEGFGLPVVKALAYGRPVVARASALWHEVAAHTRLPGTLTEYRTTTELVEAVGTILAGHVASSLTYGASLSDERAPATWADCARQLVDAVEDAIANTSAERWMDRERVLEMSVAS